MLRCYLQLPTRSLTCKASTSCLGNKLTSRYVERAPKKRLERTRHERASSLSCVGEPLIATFDGIASENMKPVILAFVFALALNGAARAQQSPSLTPVNLA